MPNQDSPAVFACVLCSLPAFIFTRLSYAYLTNEDPHHSAIAYFRHALGASDVPEAKINEYGWFDFKRMPSQSVIFLYNSSMPHHMEFMHDVRVANWKHEMTIYRHDCVKVNSICASLGHGAVHDYEPPLLFYHDGEWSESFHDDIQTGKAPKPTTRQERVQSMIRWIDNASPSAANKLFEREQMFAKMRHEGSPMQKYMREIHKKEAEKNKDGAAKGSEEAKVEL